jgi:hypothetical protein
LCFCDRCKAVFEKQFGLSGLSWDEIMEKHLVKWKSFALDRLNKMRSIKRKILNKYGIVYFIHDEGPEEEMNIQESMIGACDVIDCRDNFMSEPEPETARRLKEGRTVRGGSTYGWYSDDPRIWRYFVIRAAAFGRCGPFKYETAAETVAGKGGIYYLAEASKFIERFEPFFIEGDYTQARWLASSDKAVKVQGCFSQGNRKLVLVFNETRKDRRTTLRYIGRKM